MDEATWPTSVAPPARNRAMGLASSEGPVSSEGGEMDRVEEAAGRGRGATIVGTVVVLVALVGSIAWLRHRNRHDLPEE
jgi:hypothetical protein